MIDLRQIRYFVETAAEGNVTRAAKRLRITQPALSRQLAALEDGLELPLFERAGRGIRLTPAARDLLPDLRDLLARADAVQERATTLAGHERVRLSLIAPPQSIEVFLADALGLFLHDYPDAEIKIIEAAAEDIQGLLERGEGQMAIAARPIGLQLQARTVARGFIHVALPDDHRLAAMRRLGVRDLDHQPVLVMKRGTLSREMFDSACRLGQTAPRIAHESSSPHALAAMAAAGIGIAVMPFTARIETPGLSIRKLHAGSEPLSADLAVVWNPNLYMTPALLALVGLVAASMHAAPFLEPVAGGA